MLSTYIAILGEKEHNLLQQVAHTILQLVLRKNPPQLNQFKFSNLDKTELLFWH